MQHCLEIRLLGDLQVWAGVSEPRRAVALPPSKKTRALLGYLLLTGRPQRRERLCELFWDVADDPRAALRWSLSKLREVLDQDGRARLLASRDQVAVDMSGVTVDALQLKALLSRGPDGLETAHLEQALALFRGELLEGLELPDFAAYHAFCVAERAALRDLHRRVLELLQQRHGPGARAVPLLRAMVQLDPLDESSRAQLLALLRESGRGGEAERESRATQRLLGAASLPLAAATPPPAEVDETSGRISRLFEPEVSPSEPRAPFVGRDDELARLISFFSQPQTGARVALVEGDPGIGKSRLAAELLVQLQAQGIRVRRVGLPEQRLGFPYAPFRELLEGLGTAGAGSGLMAALPLSARAEVAAQDREELFRAVVSCVQESLGSRPLLVAIEDVQWMDEGSLSLLHVLVSSLRRAPLGLLLTARRGELSEQPSVRRTLRALKRDVSMMELSLGPLAAPALRALLEAVGTRRPAERVIAESGGHPLFALELARQTPRAGEALPGSLVELIRDRLLGLEADAEEALRWASVLGASFQIESLGQLLTCNEEQLVEALEYLERHGFVCLTAREGVSGCTFSHEVVRHAVYHQLSEPRRRLMHARIAKLLMADGELSEERAAHVAHHAALAGDGELAASACLSAARRCLRLFAPEDALSLARRGLRYAEGLSEPRCVTLSMSLLQVAIDAERPVAEELRSMLVAHTRRALDLGDAVGASTGFYLQSLLTFEGGQVADAGRFTREAERITRASGDLRHRLVGLGEAARCLLCLERDLPDADAFLREAEALAARGRVELPLIVHLARGMLLIYRGQLSSALPVLSLARELAHASGDRINEFHALEGLVDLQLQAGALREAQALTHELCSLGERLRQGSEGPRARALTALVRYVAGSCASSELAQAIDTLRLADAKQRTASTLVRAAEHELVRGELSAAEAHAREAERLAAAVEQASDVHAARCLLAALRLLGGDSDGFRALSCELDASRPSPLSAYAKGLEARVLSTAPTATSKKKGAHHGARHRRAPAD